MGTGKVKSCLALAFLVPAVSLYSQDADSLHRHYELDKSVVTSEMDRKAVSGLMTGNVLLDVENLDWLPQILGTPDILRTLQLMPGMTASGEMDSGIYLRGADPGQVSVLFDDAKIYFPSHLLSFYSVFNSDHISSAAVLKSGVSPSYGSGVSGIIDVKSPESLFEKTGGKLNVGIISSQATLSARLGEKSSLRLSGRGTYINWILKTISLMQGQAQPEYGFGDANLTWLYKPDSENTIKLNAYWCKDNLNLNMDGYSMDGNMDWTNAVASLGWTRTFADNIRMKHAAAFSLYDNFVRMSRENIHADLPSGIMDFTYRGNVSFPFGQNSLLLGADYTFHRTKVQSPSVYGLYGVVNESDMKPLRTHEYSAYAEWSKWFSFPVELNIGLRCSGAVTDGTFYSGLEPRLSISYDFRENMRLRASVMKQMQYVNTVSVSGMGLPSDFLIPVTSSIRPQASHTASVGFSNSFHENMFEYSIEPYCSYLANVLEFDGGMFDLLGGSYSAEDHVLSGSGLNYGVEFMFKKNRGKFNGWVSYTWGRSLRVFPDILDGDVFASKHDRPHSLSVVANYNLSPRWTFSAVFVYGTGTPYTRPTGLYMIGGNIIHEYGTHNGARMPDYNRLDLSATYNFPKKGRLSHSLNLSVYNVYAAKNPLFWDIKPEFDPENPNSLNLRLVRVRLYTILPSLSYSLSF